MLEAEWAFTQRVDDVCRVVEHTIKHILRNADNGGTKAAADLDLTATSEISWTRMTYTDAISELSKHERRFECAPGWGKPLRSEHEKWLAEELVGGPVFVTDYPIHQKPFYMRANDDGKTAACFDLLVPHVGELVGGSLREERLDVLKESMHRHGLQERDYAWYLDLRKFGGAPHGGFGMGFERLIGWMTGIESVRECIAMPRWSGRMLL
jgi:asparaginyl-tRNA synthetase